MQQMWADLCWSSDKISELYWIFLSYLQGISVGCNVYHGCHGKVNQMDFHEAECPAEKSKLFKGQTNNKYTAVCWEIFLAEFYHILTVRTMLQCCKSLWFSLIHLLIKLFLQNMTLLVLLRISHTSCKSGTFVTVVCAFRSCGRICCCKNVGIQNINGLTTRPEVFTCEMHITVLHIGERFWTIIAL